jgi:hypothetical protein
MTRVRFGVLHVTTGHLSARTRGKRSTRPGGGGLPLTSLDPSSLLHSLSLSSIQTRFIPIRNNTRKIGWSPWVMPSPPSQMSGIITCLIEREATPTPNCSSPTHSTPALQINQPYPQTLIFHYNLFYHSQHPCLTLASPLIWKPSTILRNKSLLFFY